jgi:fermentation-respiration switch protein FrsA (DUF1100 family)/acyl carrier protein
MTERRTHAHAPAGARTDTNAQARGPSARMSSRRPLQNTLSAGKVSSRMTKHHRLLLALLLVGVTLAMLSSLLFMASDCEPATMMDTIHALPEHISWHSLMTAMVLVATIGMSMVGAFIGLAFALVHMLTRPQQKEPFMLLTPWVLDLPAEEVGFPPLHGAYLIRGIYSARPDATTTILISPGYRRPLTDVLGICKHLWAAGHNVLAFDYYGHGAVVGVPVTLGYREVNDFLGAVSYARQRAPHARIGALGYGMGGAVSIIGSAYTSEVCAVVADSAFASPWSVVELAVRRRLHLPPATCMTAMRILRRITDMVLAQRVGYHFHEVEPGRVIARLAPRPILLIQGLDDTIVPPNDSVQLYEAATRPKALWHIPGTEHCKAYVTDPQTYICRVVTFFDRSLKQSASVMPEQERVYARAEECRDDRSLPGSEQIAPQQSAPFAARAARSNAPSQAEVEETLVQIIAHIFAVPKERIGHMSDIFEYGGDSHTLKALLILIEEQFHVHVRADEIWDHSIVRALAARIIQKRKKREEG